MLIDLIAGARPNFMKIAPIIRALKKAGLRFRLIHTGQHYDHNMSGQFFSQLDIPEPDFNLGAGGGTPAAQTATIMIGYEQVLIEKPSNLCVVVGDVTSTMACAITAQKMHVPVAHVEGGIRSGDWRMPEEINRLVTDSISNYFYTTSSYANDNLLQSGINQNRIVFVGNTMIDTLLYHLPNLIVPSIFKEFGLINNPYFVITLHRPSNVDDDTRLVSILKEILANTQDYPVIFPIHPRTAAVLKRTDFSDKRLKLAPPMSYLEFIYLVSKSFAVITDSGGITEETTVLGIPCMTLRDSTERPETVTMGTNELIGSNINAIAPTLKKLFSGNWKKGVIPPLWDGKAAERIVNHFMSIN